MNKSIQAIVFSVLAMGVLGIANARCPIWSVYDIEFEVLACEQVSFRGVSLTIDVLNWEEVQEGGGYGWLGVENSLPRQKKVFYKSSEIDCASIDIGERASARAQSRCCDGGEDCKIGVAVLYSFRQDGV